MAYLLEAPDDIDRLDIPVGEGNIDTPESFEGLFNPYVYLPTKTPFNKGETVFVGQTGWEQMRSFVSYTPVTIGAHAYDNHPKGFYLWYGRVELPTIEVMIAAHGAFQVLEYFPNVNRVHLKRLFDEDDVIENALERVGYGNYVEYALAQVEYFKSTRKCISGFSEQWAKVVSHLDDHDTVALQRERAKKAA